MPLVRGDGLRPASARGREESRSVHQMDAAMTVPTATPWTSIAKRRATPRPAPPADDDPDLGGPSWWSSGTPPSEWPSGPTCSDTGRAAAAARYRRYRLDLQRPAAAAAGHGRRAARCRAEAAREAAAGRAARLPGRSARRRRRARGLGPARGRGGRGVAGHLGAARAEDGRGRGARGGAGRPRQKAATGIPRMQWMQNASSFRVRSQGRDDQVPGRDVDLRQPVVLALVTPLVLVLVLVLFRRVFR